MRALTVAKIMWLTSVLIVAGCTVKTDDPGTQAGTGAVGGAAGVGTAAGVGGMMAGMDGQVVAGATGGTAGAGGAGAGGAGAGAGGAGAGGAGAGGAGAGAGGDPDGGGAGTGAGPDTTGFQEDCLQGGAQWGTDTQFGPCKSGISVYGVATEFGPYGVRAEYNVGTAFNTGNTAASDFLVCGVFIDSFGADPTGSADLKMTHDLDFGLFSVFYPGDMPEGEKFPLITWGNGTCAMPEGYGPLLRYVASFGYIVVAANSVQVGSGAQQRKAIDFMLAENDNPESKYYQRIDVDNIGAMGHSQGGMGTVAAAADARIKSVILFNGGTTASKPFLAISGDKDIGGTPSGSDNAVQASQQPGAWLWFHQIPAAVDGSTTGTTAPGHLTLMMEPERVQEATVAWWDMRLKGREEAKAMFLGDACTLCDPNAFTSMWPPATSGSSSATSIEYGHNALLQ